mgnify:CR=1 FL=1
MDNLRFRLNVQLGIFILVMIVGIAGIMYFENKTFLQSLYFSIVTVSTVGYGDMYPTTMVGKYLVIFMILTGVGTFVGVIATFTEMVLSKRELKIRNQKLHILMGLFFSEIGNKLLVLFLYGDNEKTEMRSEIDLSGLESEQDFKNKTDQLQKFHYTIEPQKTDFIYLQNFLSQKKELLVRFLENPYLIDHENFTELIRSIFHLFEELQYRMNVSKMIDDDKDHVVVDINRIYKALVPQWLDYMLYIKGDYPYLYKYALKMNPFIESCKMVSEVEKDLN